MSFKDISIKPTYDSDQNNVLDEFYIPMLKETTRYDRLAGFFSSSTLAAASRGLSQFIKNGGEMRLVVGANLSSPDIEAINEGYENLDEKLETEFIEQIEDIQNKFEKRHVKALSWMIEQGNLEIKVAVLRDEEGKIVPKSKSRGMFHQKVGILKDGKGNEISFSGSDNETKNAWKHNIEEFKVFRGWNDCEKKYLESDKRKFRRFWENNSLRADVMDIPDAVEKELMEKSPESIQEIDLPEKEQEESINLWPPQEEALEAWKESGRSGVFRMATGTGKTYAALGCVRDLFEKEKNAAVVIATPRNQLVKQWSEVIDDFGFREEKVIASGRNDNWKEDLSDIIYDLNFETIDKAFLLTTHKTFSNEKFMDKIKDLNKPVFLIVDEVHGIGAPTYQKGLNDNYKYKLGLSATPERWFDDEGTEAIFSFFEAESGPTYSFGMEKAINEVNPKTGETYLCPYEYKPKIVELTPDEVKEYTEESRKLVKTFHAADSKEKRDEIVSQISINRQKIIKNAENKFEALNDLLKDLGNIEKTLIYSSPGQLDRIKSILNERKVTHHKFTMDEDVRPKKKLGGNSERDQLLDIFSKGHYDALISMNVLDEGVNVESAKRGILMSSSRNPRQYIQRRGRLLRHSDDKEKAVIHDMIALPPKEGPLPEDFTEIEKKIVKKELERYKEFSEIAENSIECTETLREIKRRFDL